MPPAPANNKQVQPAATTALRSISPSPIVPQSVAELMALGELFFRGGMAPRGCTRPESVAAIIAFGLEIGIRPAAAVNSIMLQNGKATVWGDIPLAMVQASGLLENWKEWIDGSGEDRTAHCILHRRGDPDGPKEFTYSVAQVRQMDLFMKGGKKGPWDKDTDWMLARRCRGRGFLVKFADVLNGLGIGEADDHLTADTTTTTATVRPAEKEAPVAVTSTPPVAAVMDGIPMADDSQITEIRLLVPTWVRIAGPSGVSEKDGVLAFRAMMRDTYGVDSTTKLTHAQAFELLMKLREIERSPTAGLFAPPTTAAKQADPAEVVVDPPMTEWAQEGNHVPPTETATSA